jgi:hypothetical protein
VLWNYYAAVTYSGQLKHVTWLLYGGREAHREARGGRKSLYEAHLEDKGIDVRVETKL